jgi:lipid II:glycine glycyltransferase (peptidoglycan interpeptide bridge formation enzyme)
MAGTMVTITWLHATKNKLINKDLTQREIHTISLGAIVPTDYGQIQFRKNFSSYIIGIVMSHELIQKLPFQG